LIEVFVAFTRESNISDLEKTLEAWNLPGLEPIAIQIKQGKKFELHRRVTAESVSRGTYILSDMMFGPCEVKFAELAEQALGDNPDAGMIIPNGIVMARVCRKGIITHWPTPRTVTYTEEHAEAYKHAGYKVIPCPSIHCLPLAESLPS
jgi:hypothetical protein